MRETQYSCWLWIMGNQYLALISGFIGALIGAGASLLTVWIQGRYWLRQKRWIHRERLYLDLLSNLNKLKLSLEDRSEYYEEPGSEHDSSRSDSERFQELARSGIEAMSTIREQTGPASVFLSDRAVAALENLIREHWHTSQDSICTADYVRSLLDLVAAAYSSVLDEAKVNLSDV